MTEIKAVLFDVDGVVIRGRHKYFSDRLSQEHGIPLEEIMPFFKNEYGLCAIGQADLKQVLPPYFKRWGWTKSTEDFMDYWFQGEKDLDQQVLGVVDKLRTAGLLTGLATDNERYRAQFLLDVLKVGEHFDKTYVSAHIGHKKPNPEFFSFVLEDLQLPPSKILYWDDDIKNVTGAQTLGIQAKHYQDFPSFQQEMERLSLLPNGR